MKTGNEESQRGDILEAKQGRISFAVCPATSHAKSSKGKIRQLVWQQGDPRDVNESDLPETVGAGEKLGECKSGDSECGQPSRSWAVTGQGEVGE